MAEDRETDVPTCRICGHSAGNRIHDVREMMFGLGETFPYSECAHCGCLQLEHPPATMERYYPPNYYSLSSSPMALFHSRLTNVSKRLRTLYAVTNRGLIGRLSYARSPDINLRSLAGTGTTTSSRILDVGCGTGLLLCMLRNAGFSHLLGVDPFIEASVTYANGVTVRKQSIHEVEGEWDVVMFHHSFEHVADPLRTMQSAARLLAAHGLCLIRIPVASSFAWQHYGVNWVQLDAPRHYFLHTVESMQLLASQAGLIVERVVHDSTEFQFWGSEQYAKDIPLMSDQSYRTHPEQSIFSAADIRAFQARAAELNRQGNGDTAAFHLRKPPN